MPAPLLAAAAVPAIAAGISAVGNTASTLFTNRSNRRLAEYAYSKDLEMWNRQNAYNHPAEQMKRLKMAGLNPNLMYGQGQKASSGVANQLPKYQRPEMRAPQVDPLTAAQTSLLLAQAKKTGKEADLIDDKKGKITAETLEIDIRNQFNKWFYLGQGKELGKFNREEDKITGTVGAVAAMVKNEQGVVTINLTDAQKRKVLAETANVKSEAAWHKLKGTLAENKVNINDPIIMRVLYSTLKEKGLLDDNAAILAMAALLLK